MVLIVTVVVPQIGDIGQVQLRSAARSLMGTSRHTCFLALLTKKDYVLNYDLEKQEYWVGESVYNPELKSFEQVVVKHGIGRKRRLPEGIVFGSVEAAERASRTKGMELTYFSRLGEAEKTTIELKDRKNRTLPIHIPAYGCHPTVPRS